MESDQNRPMSIERNLIDAHVYQILATFAVVYGAIQIAPIAYQERHYNNYVEGLIVSFEKKGNKYSHHHVGYGQFLPEVIYKVL